MGLREGGRRQKAPLPRDANAFFRTLLEFRAFSMKRATLQPYVRRAEQRFRSSPISRDPLYLPGMVGKARLQSGARPAKPSLSAIPHRFLPANGFAHMDTRRIIIAL
ncbi:hypothetical protein [Azospirillum sp. B506]|uniref:hypothetical protein n=1 Tax=Azospirillum sp. B506 TaxID=137721 RepID=UPI0011DE4605|nr:hypothetical protein [Azospirillum sp. B506]